MRVGGLDCLFERKYWKGRCENEKESGEWT